MAGEIKLVVVVVFSESVMTMNSRGVGIVVWKVVGDVYVLKDNGGGGVPSVVKKQGIFLHK